MVIFSLITAEVTPLPLLYLVVFGGTDSHQQTINKQAQTSIKHTVNETKNNPKKRRNATRTPCLSSSSRLFPLSPPKRGGQTLIVGLYGGFVFDARSRPSDPNPNPMPVVSAGMLCLVRLSVDSAGVDAELGKTTVG